MAVLAPLNRSDALPRLREAGVEEIYVGFHDERWAAHFGAAELNRMSGFGREANPFTFEQMCEQLGRAADLGMQAFVCFNASQYSREQLAFIEREYLPDIASARGSGVIVSGQGLLAPIREAGMQAVVSTVAGVFNAPLAAHYRNRGATRIILPRDLSSDEIASIVRSVPDVEYEVFLMRNGCVFSDSHCLGRHCSGMPSLCLSLRGGDMRIREVNRADFANRPSGTASMANPEAAGHFTDETAGNSAFDVRHDHPTASRSAIEAAGHPAPNPDSDASNFLDAAYENERIWAQRYHRRTCGLCALWRFEQLGIAAYKVVGRGDDVDDLVADAALVAHNAKLARECATEQEYLAHMELPRHPETLCGNEGLSCYYPEIGRLAQGH